MNRKEERDIRRKLKVFRYADEVGNQRSRDLNLTEFSLSTPASEI